MPQSAELDRLAEIIARRDTILFIGSGVSVWSGLPTWWGLLEDLCRFLDSVGRSAELVRREMRNNDLLLAASFGFDQLSRHERCEFLRGACLRPDAEPSPLHHAIAALGSRCFVTTNYDTLLERTLRQARATEYFDVVTPLQQLEIASIVQSRADGFVFKPHGDIGSCDSVILTREDYRSLHAERRNVLEATRTLLVSRPTVFVGFGLRDPDFLLIRDLLLSTFGTHPPDHYALMPDIVEAEAEYWRRHYGIRLLSCPTDPAALGAQRHRSLLTLIEGLATRRGQAAPAGDADTTSRKVLALARHARRMVSSIPAAPEAMPLMLGPARFKQREPLPDSRWIWGQDAATALKSHKGSLALEGAPGSGKSFSLEQAVREIALELEEQCLADSPRRFEELRVPVLIRLRDYRGDITSLIADALPVDVQPEEIFGWANGVFFIDGVNEVPAAHSPDDLLADLASFVGWAKGCTVVLTTRFGEELASLGLPTLSLDEISHKYVLAQITEAGVDPESLHDETIELLRRPLYFNAWRTGLLDLATATTVHDVYSQLVSHLEAGARERFGDVTFGDVFGKIAYSMIESGDLSVPVAQVHVEVRAGLPETVDVAEFINHQISTGTLLATPLRRLAFFHHSVAEYFAARYLARLATVDPGTIRRCLGRRDWDQALLLTLGFLPAEQTTAVFGEVMSADPAMALRALNYVEAQRADWTERALTFLADLRHGYGDMDTAYALSRLRVTTANETSLLKIVERGNHLGGAAASRLWDAAPHKRSWVRDLLLDGTRGFNFLVRLAHSIGGRVTGPDALALLQRLASTPVDEASERRLLRREWVDDYSRVIIAVSCVIDGLSIDTRIALARGGPVLLRCIIVENLRHLGEPSAVAFIQELIVAGDDHAIFGLHSQLNYAISAGAPLPQPLPGLVTALLAAVREGREPQWALGVLRRLVQEFPDLAQEISVAASCSGLMPALAAYAIGDFHRFFSVLEDLVDDRIDWSAEPVEALWSLKVSWADHSDLLLRLLRLRQTRLARSLLEDQFTDSEVELRCQLNDLEFWVEWLAELDADDDWYLCDRLGKFLALHTDEATRQETVRRFNEDAEHRPVLGTHVLANMRSTSIDDLSVDAVEWLLSDLGRPGYTSDWLDPPVVGFATEEFVQRRLIPMLLDAPEEPLRGNLLHVLRQAGVRHRRRYVDENGALLG